VQSLHASTLARKNRQAAERDKKNTPIQSALRGEAGGQSVRRETEVPYQFEKVK
jgi:hypothetical protein